MSKKSISIRKFKRVQDSASHNGELIELGLSYFPESSRPVCAYFIHKDFIYWQEYNRDAGKRYAFKRNIFDVIRGSIDAVRSP